MIRLIVCIGVALFLFVTILFFGIAIESSYILENWYSVSPLQNVKQGVWLAQFRNAAFNASIMALVFTLIWNFVGFFGYQIKDWRNAKGKLAWWSIAGLKLVSIGIYGWIYTPESQDLGKILAILIYLFNSIVIYWFSSFLMSPASVKYVPPLSQLSPTQRIPLQF